MTPIFINRVSPGAIPATALACLTFASSIMSAQAQPLEEADRWALCRPLPASPVLGRIEAREPEADETAIRIFADQAVAQSETTATFRGNVLARRGTQVLAGDSATYSRVTDVLNLEGAVTLYSPTYSLQGEAAEFNLRTNHGWVSEALFQAPGEHAWGQAGRAEVLGEQRARLVEATYTTCDPDDIDWQLRASRIELDRATNTGEAYDTSLWFLGVPILYLPYINFPIEGRKTGLLAPSYGSSDVNGTELLIPYYWNIAPNYDATTTLRQMENRGTMLLSEFRFLTPDSRGNVTFDYLPDDRIEKTERHRFSTQYNARPVPRWSTRVNYNHFSDANYYEDLGNRVTRLEPSDREQRANVSYQGNNWSFDGQVLDYQTLEGLSDPYRKVPQLTFRGGNADSPTGSPVYDFRTEFVRFEHETLTPVGGRTDLEAGATIPWNGSSWFLRPRASARYTRYDLSRTGASDEDTPDRSIPTFSVDSGLFLERDLTVAGRPLLQTLEPRLYYLYVPFVDQSELPLFDTSEYTFSFSQLFRPNRFTGADRVSDANQISAALTTRFIDGLSGREYLSGSVGQIYYFEDRRVTLGTDPPPDRGRSNLIGEATASLDAYLRLNGTLEWDPYQDETRRTSWRVTWQPGPRSRLSAAFVSRKDGTPERQTDLTVLWPLSPRWHLVGRWFYDHVAENSLETVLGFEYENCCWSVRLLGQTRQVEDVTTQTGETFRDTERTFIITLNLKGLGEIGRKLEDVLSRGALGFQGTQESVY